MKDRGTISPQVLNAYTDVWCIDVPFTTPLLELDALLRRFGCVATPHPSRGGALRLYPIDSASSPPRNDDIRDCVARELPRLTPVCTCHAKERGGKHASWCPLRP